MIPNTLTRYTMSADLYEVTVDDVTGGPSYKYIDTIEVRNPRKSHAMNLVRIYTKTLFDKSKRIMNIRSSEDEVLFPDPDRSNEGVEFRVLNFSAKTNPWGEIEEYEYILTDAATGESG